jgi:N-acylmannosamine kinase
VTALNPTTLPIENGFPLAAALAEQLGETPLLINDAQAAAWAESRLGAGQGTRAMAFITVSTGIGGGLVIDGRVQTGRQGLAGHIGHVVADPAGPQCGCGRRGCIERLASGTALSVIATERLCRPMTAVDVFNTAAAGEAIAQQIIDKAAQLLGRTIVDCVALLDVDRVVIGGGVGLAPGFLALVRSQIALEPLFYHRPLLAAQLGADAGLIGAALLRHDEKFHQKIVVDD